MKTNPLIGATITALKIASDRKALKFITDAGEVIVRADGDCCSETWIESVELPARGFPAAVVEVEDLSMPDLGGSDGYSEIAYYGCKVTTSSGEMVIDYRNESNGYYGGNLTWPGDYHYGGVYGQNDSNEDWKDLAELEPTT